MSGLSDLGVLGLAVMGANLARNAVRNGFGVALYNRHGGRTDDLVRDFGHEGRFTPTKDLRAFVDTLATPRVIVLMVQAGKAVDDVIAELLPYVEADDIVIDGGNSLFTDTERRFASLKEKKVRFVGMGVSGGEIGALEGPSMMPGGDREAYARIEPMVTRMAAQVAGAPCCTYIGPGGAGHYVKMVHNGIEYGDMQLICEAYDILKHALNLTPDELAKVFAEWNKGELDSFLIEISSQIFAKKDEDGTPLVDKILDTAGQKGTGKWTVESALDLGMPVTLIGESVFARCLSAIKEERVAASKVLQGPTGNAATADRADFIENVRRALYCSKIISYAQGYMLLREAAKAFGWRVNMGGIALMWRGGCIIRSRFLGKIKEAYDKQPDLHNLLFDSFFSGVLNEYQASWRKAIVKAIALGVPAPAFSTALSFYDGYRTARLPANLLQAQRDFFGAHTYERVDQPRGQFFHTNWTGRGGRVSSSTYNV